MISVVIPSIGRDEILIETLRQLAAQRYPDWECLAILQGKRNNTLAERLYAVLGHRLRVFHQLEPNASLARNVGLTEARGDLVLFLDDDVLLPDPRFLFKHARNYADPAVPGVYGQVLEVGQAPTTEPDPDVIQGPLGWTQLPPNYARRCRTRNGGSGNLSVRRQWAIKVGGMDAHFSRGARREETEFNLRFTERYGPLIFDPEASVIHLSASGGSRSWGRVQRQVPMHHIVGHWYFLLRARRNCLLDRKTMLLELRYIVTALWRNPRAGLDPIAFLLNTWRALSGLFIATICLVQGPRNIHLLDANEYCLLPNNSIVRRKTISVCD